MSANAGEFENVAATVYTLTEEAGLFTLGFRPVHAGKRKAGYAEAIKGKGDGNVDEGEGEGEGEGENAADYCDSLFAKYLNYVSLDSVLLVFIILLLIFVAVNVACRFILYAVD